MIYTLTLCPSLDYYMELEEDIKIHKLNRSTIEYYEAGGKGINVSKLLSNLGISTKALGFLGGFNKEFYLKNLERYRNLEPKFIYTNAVTRINVKVIGKKLTEINGIGQSITPDEQDKLYSKIEFLTDDDVLIISGNIPTPLYSLTEKILKYLSANNIRFTLDIDAESLNRFIKYKPLLVKPNLLEASEIFKEEVNENNVTSYVKKLKEMGAENAIISMSNKGSVLYNNNGLYKAGAIDKEAKHQAGSGDSMIAGFVFNLLRGFNEEESYRYAACCSLATTFTDNLDIREKIDSYYDEFEIEKLEG